MIAEQGGTLTAGCKRVSGTSRELGLSHGAITPCDKSSYVYIYIKELHQRVDNKQSRVQTVFIRDVTYQNITVRQLL